MILVLLVVIPLLGGVGAALAGRFWKGAPRYVALFALLADFALVLPLFGAAAAQGAQAGGWLASLQVRWIPQLGIGFHLAADGLSVILVALTAFLGLVAVASSWTEITERVGFFYFNLLWCLAGIVGVFLALDLFLFYFFWELMLVPLYFVISIWGHENRQYAAVKFFIFTQLSGLFMLAAILGLYFIHWRATGEHTFDYVELLRASLGRTASLWLMGGFLAAFLVKLPAFFFHTWLPDAHTEAPTAGSVILAGLLLKTGAYGLLRFAVPLFPEAAAALAWGGVVLAVAGILYGAVMAFSQTDLKRLVAYTSVSHMGFVLLAVSIWNNWALEGAVVQIVSHGISTGALFVLVGELQERVGSREMAAVGGLWSAAPRMGGMAMIFALASVGLPGMGNFVGEFLVLLGAYKVNPWAAGIAAIVLVASAIYGLWFMQQAFFGGKREGLEFPDLRVREVLTLSVMAALIIAIGIYPGPVLRTARHGIQNLSRLSQAAQVEAALTEPMEGMHESK
jgi:NADH-quinone oxidoreductase subunit M